GAEAQAGFVGERLAVAHLAALHALRFARLEPHRHDDQRPEVVALAAFVAADQRLALERRRRRIPRAGARGFTRRARGARSILADVALDEELGICALDH